MRGLLVLGLVLTLLLISVSALALEPSITVMPIDKLVSANSSFILRVNPNTIQKPIRVTWSVIGGGERGLGSFPLVDGIGLCYFSNVDENATCGPSPFTKSGEQQLYINVITPTGIVNATKTLNISKIFVPLNHITVVDNVIYIRVGGDIDSGYTVTYHVYTGELDYVAQRSLSYDPIEDKHMGNYTFPSAGVYYVFIQAVKGDSSGSNVYRVYLPSSDYVNMQSGKDVYWLGETVQISGDASQTVSGEILFPNKSKAMNFVPALDAGGSFTKTFSSLSSWPEGNYSVHVTSPVDKTIYFLLQDLIEITPSSVSDLVNKSSSYRKTLAVRNLRDVTLNLSLITTGDIKSSHVSLSKTHLASQETGSLMINVSSVDNNMEGTVRVITGGIELAIPVEILTEEKKPGCPECPECPEFTGGSSVLSVTNSLGSKMISIEMVENSEFTETIKIKNTGSSSLSSFSFSAGGDLSYIESDMSMELSGVSVAGGSSEEVDLAINPYSSGTYSGPLTITSGGNSDSVYIHIIVYPEMYSDIQNAQDDLRQMQSSLSSTLYSTIDSYLRDADSAYSLENYQEAQAKLDKANVLLSTARTVGLSPGGGGGGFDPTIIIIIVIVIIAGVGIFYFLKMRKAGGGYSGEDGYEEGGEEETFENF
ncbi:MAG: hypothetical protein JW754_05225 [Candidatus Aenigmarchaeota archaeon]|nr:hypothetical protein [Candidatus Aenigmarchaeota archaeon]